MDDVTFCKLHTLHWRSGHRIYLSHTHLLCACACACFFEIFIFNSIKCNAFICVIHKASRGKKTTTINGIAPLSIESICWRATLLHTEPSKSSTLPMECPKQFFCSAAASPQPKHGPSRVLISFWHHSFVDCTHFRFFVIISLILYWGHSKNSVLVWMLDEHVCVCGFGVFGY